MLCMLVPFAQASMRIAVVDSEMAVVQSDAAKRYEKEAEAKFAPRIKNLNALQSDVQGMEEKLQKDGPTLSQPQLESRKLEIRRKIEDLRMQDQQLRQDKQVSDQTELGKIRPKLEKAIEQVSEASKFDIVLERRVAHYVKPEFDITRKVIDSLNKMK
ncbi:hypothetical protein ACH42_12985 [Endozoicomonas sp. (ex Bugula neritina AB1)]|nr:hypothetical protein ACH42_12985 [Endozoicomonas sp. (ex Bugula neritina AB1)]